MTWSGAGVGQGLGWPPGSQIVVQHYVPIEAGWQAGRLFDLLVSLLRISLWTENLAGKV